MAESIRTSGGSDQFGKDASGEQGVLVGVAERRLISALQAKHRGNPSWVREYRQIRIDLMRAHAGALANDSNRRLSAIDVARYHWRVFEQHGLPRSTFGGGGTYFMVWATQGIWCSRCDSHWE